MYYRLLNTYNQSYDLHTYDETSLGEVKKRLWGYFEGDQKEMFGTTNIKRVSLKRLIECSEFILEKSKKPFPSYLSTIPEPRPIKTNNWGMSSGYF